MTPRMQTIQDSIVEVIDAVIAELKGATRMDFSEASVGNTLVKHFDLAIRRELDPVWHKLAGKSKQLVADLGILRRLLSYLISYDCVTFYRFLHTVRTEAKNHGSLWLFTEAANRLFSAAKARVFVLHGEPSSEVLAELSSKRSKARRATSDMNPTVWRSDEYIVKR